jgi:hypothetical protein
LTDLNADIQQWVVKSLLKCKEEIAEEEALEVKESMARPEFRPHGTSTVEQLPYSIATIYKKQRAPLVLIRHIIALYLWRYVFSPFAFGLSDDASETLSEMAKQMINGIIDPKCQ